MKKNQPVFSGFKSWVCLAWWIMWIPWRWFMLILKLLPFSTHDWKPTGQRNHTWLPSQVYLSHLLLDPSHLLLCRKTRWSSVDSRDRRDWLKYLPGVGHSHHYHIHTELVSNHSKNQTKGKLARGLVDVFVNQQLWLNGWGEGMPSWAVFTLKHPLIFLLSTTAQLSSHGPKTPPSHPEPNIFIDQGDHQIFTNKKSTNGYNQVSLGIWWWSHQRTRVLKVI